LTNINEQRSAADQPMSNGNCCTAQIVHRCDLLFPVRATRHRRPVEAALRVGLFSCRQVDPRCSVWSF